MKHETEAVKAARVHPPPVPTARPADDSTVEVVTQALHQLGVSLPSLFVVKFKIDRARDTKGVRRRTFEKAVTNYAYNPPHEGHLGIEYNSSDDGDRSLYILLYFEQKTHAIGMYQSLLQFREERLDITVHDAEPLKEPGTALKVGTLVVMAQYAHAERDSPEDTPTI